MADLKKLAEELVNLTVLEVNELSTILKDEYGIEPAAAAVIVAAGGAEAAEEQTEFDVILTNVGDQKIKVIKVVREVTGLGLKEAKAVVDEAPKPLKEGATKEEAEEIKKKIEEVGGTAEIK